MVRYKIKAASVFFFIKSKLYHSYNMQAILGGRKPLRIFWGDKSNQSTSEGKAESSNFS